MPDVSSIVTVNITATSPGVTRAGFGVPLILGTPSWATDRVRSYADISGVAADFTTDRPEYKAAAAIFAQNPKPPELMIGRLALKPTQRYTITPNVQNLTNYTMTVDGQTVTYTSDGTATATEIVNGLLALINALAAPAPTITASNVSSTLRLTSNSAGDWDSVSVADPTLLDIVEDHADPGVATDLAAILLADNTWYAFVNPWNSTAMVAAAASWAETNKRLFVADIQEAQFVTHAKSGATDEAAALQSAAYRYTSAWYHPDNGQFLAAALVGKCLPLDPGSETWAFKTLAGVTPGPTLTSTQRGNALAKNGNVYETIAGVNVTEFGTVASSEFIDVVRFTDWLVARIGERMFGDLASNIKIPYTDKGIAQLAGDLDNVLAEGVEVGGLESYTIQVPRAADADPSDRAARVLKNLNFTGTLAGAVHKPTVNGTVSV
jgi:hypothetical protein